MKWYHDEAIGSAMDELYGSGVTVDELREAVRDVCRMNPDSALREEDWHEVFAELSKRWEVQALVEAL